MLLQGSMDWHGQQLVEHAGEFLCKGVSPAHVAGLSIPPPTTAQVSLLIPAAASHSVNHRQPLHIGLLYACATRA